MKENEPKLTFPLVTLLEGRVKVAGVLIFTFQCINTFELLFKKLVT